jgi:hypothetical protein
LCWNSNSPVVAACEPGIEKSRTFINRGDRI